MDKFKTLAEAFGARFGTIANPVRVVVCDNQDHSYDEALECFDGYEFGFEPDPIYTSFHEESCEALGLRNPDRSIEATISDVLAHPNSCNDEYLAACVRTQAAGKQVRQTSNMFEEAEAVIAYASELQKIKKFW